MTVGAFFRLSVQDVIPLDKVIYLDCDVLVNMDIRDLWEIETEDNYVAAVVVAQKRCSFWGVLCSLQGNRTSLYINSGVLVLDLGKIRTQGDFFQTAMNWLKSSLHLALCGDQDVFNTLFYGHIKLFDQKFNRQIWDYNSDLSASIIHTNKRKSWKVYPEMYADCLYWKMYLMSAWGENLERDEFVDVIASIRPTQPFLHTSARQCLTRITRALWYKVSFASARNIVRMILRHVLARLTRKNTA